MVKLLKFPFFYQHSESTCGPASLKMVFDFFGLKFREKELARKAQTLKSGTKHASLIETARKNGFYCYIHDKSSINHIKHFIDVGLPVIVNYIEPSGNEGHYAVVIGYGRNKIILNDPWNGKKFKMSYKDFKERWHDSHKNHSYYGWLMVLSNEKFDIGRQYAPSGR